MRIGSCRAMIFGALLLTASSGSNQPLGAAEPDRDASQATSGAPQSAGKSNDQLIQELIEKLGSDSYATRIRARDQLKMMGLEAFDALRKAQSHDDSEIVSVARYLIGSHQVSWSKDSDPKEVREILAEYGAQNDTERLGRIELLGRLQNQMGIEPLTRLSRFDPSEALNRRAAMLVLRQPLAPEKASRLQLAEKIEEVIGNNQSDASKWLLAYAGDLRAGKYSDQRWQALVKAERKRVDAGADSEITASSVIQLIRVLASRAIAEESPDPALALVMEHIDLVTPTTRELSEHAGWAIRNGLFPVVTALYERHRHTFDENAELLYSAAQAIDEAGDHQRAQQLALDALHINPLPELVANKDEDSDGDGEPKKQDTDPQKNQLTEHQLQEIAYAHRRVALLLRIRGRFEWSERESRNIIRHCDIESIVGVKARQDLASMFSEQLRHQDAANVLFPIADRAQKDKLYQSKMSGWQVSLSRVRSLYEYESGLALLEKDGPTPNVLKQVKAKLQLAYRFDAENIDILIRMYRLDDPNDADWNTTVTKQITQYQESLAKVIGRAEAARKAIQNEQYKAELGELYNQYAWLVANTEGDYKRALKCSLDSLDFLDSDDLEHRAARLDTCARCYFALGRIEEAIQTQQEAVRIDPFSPPMLRQLQEFKKAL